VIQKLVQVFEEMLPFGKLTWNNDICLCFFFLPPFLWTREVVAHAKACAGQSMASPRTGMHVTTEKMKRRKTHHNA